MRVSLVPVKLMLLLGTDTLKVFEARFGMTNNIENFPGAGDLQRTVLRESLAVHLLGPVLPNLSVPAIRDIRTIVFSENVTNEGGFPRNENRDHECHGSNTSTNFPTCRLSRGHGKFS